MSKMFNKLLNASQGVLSQFQSDPKAVKHVNLNDYVKVAVIERNDCLVLYGPKTEKKGKDAVPHYDIILNTQTDKTYSYCLFSSQDKEEAKAKFTPLENKVPYLISIEKSLCTTNQLQTLCGHLWENDSLTVVHLCVLFDLKQHLEKEELRPHIDTKDKNGKTPLFIATESSNIAMMNKLIEMGAKLDSFDNERNNLFHLASGTSKEIVEIIIEKYKSTDEVDGINVKNNKGETPLHLACSLDKPDCVLTLLSAGADLNTLGQSDQEEENKQGAKSMSKSKSMNKDLKFNAKCAKEIIEKYPKQLQVQDIKDGGTPLHWATNRELINAFVELGCDLSAKNFKGLPALHQMVLRERLDCVMALISANCDVNQKDNDGNTALHHAIKGMRMTFFLQRHF